MARTGDSNGSFLPSSLGIPDHIQSLSLKGWEERPQEPRSLSHIGRERQQHVNPWLIHVNVWQKPLQYCKVISLQLIKINEKKKGREEQPRTTAQNRASSSQPVGRAGAGGGAGCGGGAIGRGGRGAGPWAGPSGRASSGRWWGWFPTQPHPLGLGGGNSGLGTATCPKL